MQIQATFKLLSATLMSVMLVACGGGTGSSAVENRIAGSSAPGGNTSSVASSAIGSDTLQSIVFVDVSPTTINLKGTGGAESSLVRFRTLGQTGAPIRDIKVDFTSTSNVGGIQLSQTTGKSDKDGYVSTSVISGTVSTSVRVTATVTDNQSISTQSNQLVVATGLPDEKSMSLALDKFNPSGWNYNGVTAKVSILLADAYNNPTADGTAVYFTTEGGSIQSSCTTVGGGCTVTWTSQDPRPQRHSTDNSIDRILCVGISDPILLHTCEAERAGRSTILATAIGNESFKDQNGNGIYNPDVDVFATSNDSKCTPNVPLSSYESTTSACDDLAEAYLDENESGTHETGEPFINFIADTSHDAGTDNYTPNNGLYNGAFCQPSDEANGKCSRAPITIRKEHMVVMSCDSPLTMPNTFDLPRLSIPQDIDGNYTYAVADCNGNALPVGSTITIGTNEPITIVNQYDWTPIQAAPGTAIKLSIAVSTGSGGSTATIKETVFAN